MKLTKEILDNITVKIVCTQDNEKGSGTIYRRNDRYYVLTAAHCVKTSKGKKDLLSQITVNIHKDGKSIPCKVNDVFYAGEYIDCAILCIDKPDLDYIPDILLSDPIKGEQYTLSGFAGDETDAHLLEFRYAGGEDFQALDGDVSSSKDPDSVWEGHSGGGFFSIEDSKIRLHAYLIEYGRNDGDNNYFRANNSKQFEELLDSIPSSDEFDVSDYPILELLEQKTKEGKDLFPLAKEIISELTNLKAHFISEHKEFGLHNVEFCQKVEENIFNLIGAAKLKELSNQELFLLTLSINLHDCNVILRPWEYKIMQLAEVDGERALTQEEAQQKIQEKRDKITADWDKDSSLFASTLSFEESLNHLSGILIDYQKFRIGYSNRLANIKDEASFVALNTEIRKAYVHENSQQRIPNCISRLTPHFSHFLTSDSSRLRNTLAEIISKYKGTPAEREMRETDNPLSYHYLAELLRIGITAEAYCDMTWEVPSDISRVKCKVEQGEISYTAPCKDPNDYYRLLDYVNMMSRITSEVSSLSKDWNEKYRIEAQVTRSNKDIWYDSDKYETNENLKFSLDQEKILNLLMGANLYRDPFACLRELYQNALDACRCCISEDEEDDYEGKIEFGLREEGGEKYVYCLDNGIGMTHKVIENYLFKIGNSYYNSPEFFQDSYEWKSRFKPTSGFGIGILSCFLIGTRIEIITKSIKENSECISCCISGLNGHFYYLKETPKDDAKKVKRGGTYIKIRLKKEYAESLRADSIDDLGLHFFIKHNERGHNISKDIEENKRAKIASDWKNHLFFIITRFIHRECDKVSVRIKLEDGTEQRLINFPFLLVDRETIKLCDKPGEIIKGVYFNKYVADNSQVSCLNLWRIPSDEMKNAYRNIELIDELEGIEVLIDGIVTRSKETVNEMHRVLKKNSLLNYQGSYKPQISVDRSEVSSYPDHLNPIFENLFIKLWNDKIKVTTEFIDQHSTEIENKDMIWARLLDLDFSVKIFDLIRNNSISGFRWPRLCGLVDEEMDCAQFLQSPNLTLSYRFDKHYHILKPLFDYIIPHIAKAEVKEGKINCEIDYGKTNDYKVTNYSYRYYYIEKTLVKTLVPAEDSENLWGEYDYINTYQPFLKSTADWDCIGRYLSKIDSLIIERIKSSAPNSHSIRITNVYRKNCSLLLFENSATIEQYKNSPFTFGYVREDIKPIGDCTFTMLCFDAAYGPCIIKAGKNTRDEMVSALPEEFWENDSAKELTFSDGALLWDVYCKLKQP